MILSFFSCAQKAEFETIKKNVVLYEFNNQRDKIYIIDKQGKLSIYDTENKTHSYILEDIKFDTRARGIRMYYTKSNTLYISETYSDSQSNYKTLYEIYNNKLVAKIPILSSLYIMKKYKNVEKMRTLGGYKYKEWLLSKFIQSLKINTVSILPTEQIYILHLEDSSAIALYNTISNKITDITGTIAPISQKVFCDVDSTFKAENIGAKQTINYFEDKKIVIEETSYLCEFKLMGYTKGCRYKIKITRNKKSVKLKDKSRKPRALGWGKDHWNNDINDKIPYSKYITDKNGDIYLPFYFGEEQNLIKISQ